MWKCNACGKCCESVKNILPNFALENGVCRYLNIETRKCNIYFERPLVCRVDEFYEISMKHIMTEDKYYSHQKMMCELTREK